MVDNLARKLDNAPKANIEISEAPVKWCSVSLAEMVERGKRLEASDFLMLKHGKRGILLTIISTLLLLLEG